MFCLVIQGHSNQYDMSLTTFTGQLSQEAVIQIIVHFAIPIFMAYLAFHAHINTSVLFISSDLLKEYCTVIVYWSKPTIPLGY